MLYALFLLLATPSFGVSEKSCAELGWSDEIKEGSGRYDGGLGVEFVCGTKEAKGCENKMWEDADDKCKDMGARLCTEAEYEALEAGNSGCNLEKKGRYAFTNTTCGEDGRMSIKLTEEGEVTKRCREAGEKAYSGRCCADVAVTMSPTMANTTSPTMAPVTMAPTKANTTSPTMSPVTMSPTKANTTSPTMSPVTMSPTKANTTSPTMSPVTMTPTVANITASPTPFETPLSNKTCAEMDWSDEVLPGDLGVEGVCGTKREESVCGGEMAHMEANDICLGLGVRLCTQTEYEALEAFNSGCKIEKKGRAIWTSTECTEQGGEKGSITVVLNMKGEATSECTTYDNKAYGGRCCADVGVVGTEAPTMTPTVDPDAIDEIMAELMCIAASGSKRACKEALPVTVGKCKWHKGGDVGDKCQLKVFYGSCDKLNKKDCKKAVEFGRCEYVDSEQKACQAIEE